MAVTNGNGAMRLFELDGSSLHLHSGNPVKERIAKDVVLKQNPHIDESNLYRMLYAGFWIMEGSLGSYDLEQERYPTLNDYLANRDSLNLVERWNYYIFRVEIPELEILRLAYDATRGHVLETMAELSVDEKKT